MAAGAAEAKNCFSKAAEGVASPRGWPISRSIAAVLGVGPTGASISPGCRARTPGYSFGPRDNKCRRCERSGRAACHGEANSASCKGWPNSLPILK